MIQVWFLDEDNYFNGISDFVEEVGDNMTTEPLLIGYVKAKWTGREWIEGATDEEIRTWEESAPKPIPQTKTIEELEAENKMLKAQVNALSSNQEFLEDCITEMAMIVYA